MYCFPNLNQFVIPCLVLSVASWPVYRLLRRQVRWSGIPISLRIFHSLLWSIQSKTLVVVKEAEVDVFLKFPCFFYDPTNVGNLISGSSAFSKLSLYFWNLKDFDHYLTSKWNECNCAVVWTFFGIVLLGTGMKTDLFKSCGHCWVFHICWHIECSTLTASSFRIWTRSAGNWSPPLALSLVMLDFTLQAVRL